MRDMAAGFDTTIIALLGPTGTGKSALAAALARRLGGEVVNCDAFQLYAGMAVGTAQPDAAQLALAPHRGYGWLPPERRLSAGEYARAAEGWIAQIRGRGRPVILCGGTGFYFEALVRPLPETPGRDPAIDDRLDEHAARAGAVPGALHRLLGRLDPAAAASLTPADDARVRRALAYRLQTGARFSALRQARGERAVRHAYIAFGLDADRAVLARRLAQRARRFFSGGLLAETAALRAAAPPDAPAWRAIGYREAAGVLAGELDEAAAVAAITLRSLQYAKRQRTWFRKTPGIKWLESGVDFTPDMVMDVLRNTIPEGPAPGAPARGFA
jgi:tRNA dimethylallyltransferase